MPVTFSVFPLGVKRRSHKAGPRPVPTFPFESVRGKNDDYEAASALVLFFSFFPPFCLVLFNRKKEHITKNMLLDRYHVSPPNHAAYGARKPPPESPISASFTPLKNAQLCPKNYEHTLSYTTITVVMSGWTNSFNDSSQCWLVLSLLFFFTSWYSGYTAGWWCV